MATSSAAWKGDESGGGPCCRSSMSILFPSHPNLPLFGVSQWRSSACGGWPAICCLLAACLYCVLAQRSIWSVLFCCCRTSTHTVCGTVVGIPCWFDGRSFSRTSSPSFAFGLSVPILFSLSASSSAILGTHFLSGVITACQSNGVSRVNGRGACFFFFPFSPFRPPFPDAPRAVGMVAFQPSDGIVSTYSNNKSNEHVPHRTVQGADRRRRLAETGRSRPGHPHVFPS